MLRAKQLCLVPSRACNRPVRRSRLPFRPGSRYIQGRNCHCPNSHHHPQSFPNLLRPQCSRQPNRLPRFRSLSSCRHRWTSTQHSNGSRQSPHPPRIHLPRLRMWYPRTRCSIRCRRPSTLHLLPPSHERMTQRLHQQTNDWCLLRRTYHQIQFRPRHTRWTQNCWAWVDCRPMGRILLSVQTQWQRFCVKK